MVASGQLHVLAALPPGKESLVPIQQEAGWAPEPVWILWSTEKFLAPARNWNPATQSINYTELYAIIYQWKWSFVTLRTLQHSSGAYLPGLCHFLQSVISHTVRWNVYRHATSCRHGCLSRQKETNFNIFCNPFISTFTKVHSRQVLF